MRRVLEMKENNAIRKITAVICVTAVLLCFTGIDVWAEGQDGYSAASEQDGYSAAEAQNCYGLADDQNAEASAQEQGTDGTSAVQDGSIPAEGDGAETPLLGQTAATTAKKVLKKPGKVKRLKAKSNVESVVVLKWKACVCKGYKIRYSTSKDFSSDKHTVTIKGAASGATIRNLKKGKVYYFKVRAFNKRKKKTAYGKWSEVCSVKVHKHVYKQVEYTPQPMGGGKLLRAENVAGQILMYQCSCGDAHYETKTASGKIYKGLVLSLPTCKAGTYRLKPNGSTRYIACTEAHDPVLVKKNVYKCSKCGKKINYIVHTQEEYKEKEDPQPQPATPDNGQADGGVPTDGAEPVLTEDQGGQDAGQGDAQPEQPAQPEEPAWDSDVIFTAPKCTKAECVTASVINSAGAKYDYRLYYQHSSSLMMKYESLRGYISKHGCSTCALTAVLNATVPSLADYTPDMVVKDVIRPVVGEAAYKKNFSKSLRKQMPIGLKGISKVLNAYGVRNKYVYKYTKKSAAKEIREHLKNGNPVIFTVPKCTYAGGVHTMLMLGLDKDGKVIVGDSLMSTAKKWGKNNRLIKFNTTTSKKSNTVENICKYFNASTNSTSKVGYFYNGRKGNIGYILVYKD